MENKIYSCEMIQDLLALYHDQVCSKESAAAVEQHLIECEKCREMAKQLENAEIEEQITKQAESVLKKHKNRQRRVIMILAIIAILMLIVMGVWILFPRLAIYRLVSKTVPDVGPAAEYFEEYSVTDDSLVIMEYPEFTVGIPADFVKRDIPEDATFECYDSENKEESIIITKESANLEDMNLFNSSHYEDTAALDSETIIKYTKKWFKRLGNGIPDSAYGTMKCMLLLDNDDKSMLDIGQNMAFAIAGVMKTTIYDPEHQTSIIYETDEKCGIIRVMPPSESTPQYRAYVDIFSTEDLNTAYAFIICVNNIEEIYPIINSIQIK